MENEQCLSPDTLTDYLEGSLDHAIKTVTEVHLLECESCRESLAVYMRILREQASPEEAAILQDVSARWQETKVAHGMTPPRRLINTGLLLMVAAAVIAAVIVLPFVVNRTDGPQSGQDVVRVLLADERPFEARLADAPHIPFMRTRGLEDSDVSFGLLEGEMNRLAADNYQMGRFYLIQKDFARAIPYLEMAANEAGARPEFHNDLGVAYLEAGGNENLAKAGLEFRSALSGDANFDAAVFNLALFYERSLEIPEAEQQLQRFLDLDSTSGWAEEVRAKLEVLRR